MFCTNCGVKLPNGANFCTACGARVGLSPASPSPGRETTASGSFLSTSTPTNQPVTKGPSIGPQGEILAASMPTGGANKCTWCGSIVDSGQTTCPKCGAALKLSTVVSKSGWSKLPGRKDMAKLQFGNSVCQIEGKYVPVADLKLAAEDSVYFTHHVLLWKDPNVRINAMSMRGAWSRLFSGLPLIMTEAHGPGHIAFSQDSAGELIALPLQHNQAVDVREHLFLAATGNVGYDWYQTNIWFQIRNGNEIETKYPLGQVMDRFSAGGAPGLLLLHAAGNVFVRQLAPGQMMLVKPSALVFKDPAVQMDLYIENPAQSAGMWIASSVFSSSTTRAYIWLRLTGPGRIAIQSVFDAIEGENAIVTGGSGSSLMGAGLMGAAFEALGDTFFDN